MTAGEYLLPMEFLANSEALARSYKLDESLAYTRWLATHHYENFHVVSFLLPRRLRQDFYNVYAFCRWADDLGDEAGCAEESLRLLRWWREQVDAMYAGRAQFPVFVALRQTVERHNLPPEPFLDLITAFEQDQVVSRYETLDQLRQYCRYSANPVGRLILYLCGYRDAERLRLSDATCTALQLANFWQDVSVDLEKGRIYIPTGTLSRHGCTVSDVLARRCTPQFRLAMRELVALTRELFDAGRPLRDMVGRRLSLDIDLFSRGGMLVLSKIEQLDYDVLSARTSISRRERLSLLAEALARWLVPQAS